MQSLVEKALHATGARRSQLTVYVEEVEPPKEEHAQQEHDQSNWDIPGWSVEVRCEYAQG